MSLSPLVNGVLLVLVGVAAGLLSLAVRRLVPEADEIDPAPWSSTLSYVATAYGVVVGFSILFLFGAYADARHSVGDEATSIGTAFEEMRVFGEGGVPVQQALICYGRTAAEYDWPAMRDGTSAPEVDRAYTQIIVALGEVDEPETTTFQPAVATNVLAQVGSVSTARESRLVAAETRLPAMLWALLLGGGLLVVLLIFVLTLTASGWAQAVLVGLTSAFTAVLLLLVIALNNPFAAGPGRVSPELIEQTTTSMENEVGAAPTQPCPPPGS